MSVGDTRWAQLFFLVSQPQITIQQLFGAENAVLQCPCTMISEDAPEIVPGPLYNQQIH